MATVIIYANLREDMKNKVEPIHNIAKHETNSNVDVEKNTINEITEKSRKQQTKKNHIQRDTWILVFRQDCTQKNGTTM